MIPARVLHTHGLQHDILQHGMTTFKVGNAGGELKVKVCVPSPWPVELTRNCRAARTTRVGGMTGAQRLAGPEGTATALRRVSRRKSAVCFPASTFGLWDRVVYHARILPYHRVVYHA